MSENGKVPGQGLAIVGLVLGILALVFIFIPFFQWVGIIFGIAGIILSAIAKKQGASGMAAAGLICSIIAVALCLITFLACAVCIAATLPLI